MTRTSRKGFSTAAASRPPRLSPRFTSPATRPHRRFIACKAEPPTDPSEDFEPVEEELKEGEALEMHLTEAAIKVRRLLPFPLSGWRGSLRLGLSGCRAMLSIATHTRS